MPDTEPKPIDRTELTFSAKRIQEIMVEHHYFERLTAGESRDTSSEVRELQGIHFQEYNELLEYLRINKPEIVAASGDSPNDPLIVWRLYEDRHNFITKRYLQPDETFAGIPIKLTDYPLGLYKPETGDPDQVGTEYVFFYVDQGSVPEFKIVDVAHGVGV
jgi:hypothetical protein